MKITDVKIEVVRRTLPDTGLDSDLGRFFGEVEQGVLRILTDEGIENNIEALSQVGIKAPRDMFDQSLLEEV